MGVSGYFIDIGVRHPSWPHGFVLGVECDGATYHSAKSASRSRSNSDKKFSRGLAGICIEFCRRIGSTNPQKEAQRLRGVITARLEELKNKVDELAAPLFLSTALGSIEEEPESVVDDPRASEAEDEGFAANIAGVDVGDTVWIRQLSGFSWANGAETQR